MDPDQADRFWTDIREQTDPFFSGGGPLWRLSVKSTMPPLALPGSSLIEWGGALRWIKSDADEKTIRQAARGGNGHATLIRAAPDVRAAVEVFQPLEPGLEKLSRRLKAAFDPAGILNPGRMYPGF